VVEKVWGLGGAKVGQSITLRSLNNDGMCGAASILKLGTTYVFWVEQDVTEKQLRLCDFIQFYPFSGPEEYFGAMDMDTLQC
jgi:hypothetical protein